MNKPKHTAISIDGWADILARHVVETQGHDQRVEYLKEALNRIVMTAKEPTKREAFVSGVHYALGEVKRSNETAAREILEQLGIA